MKRRRERHTLDEWAEMFDVYIQAEREGLMTFHQFSQLLMQSEYYFLSLEGLKRYMEYTAGGR